MRIKKVTSCNEIIDLPYVITVDKPLNKIGIYGDSFAQLAEEVNFNKQAWEGQFEPVFNHENTWQYFLANLLNAETHSYGVSNASLGDIAYTILNSDFDYDYYVIFHTRPLRRNVFAKIEYDATLFRKVSEFLQGKKVLNIYWDITHKIKSFGDSEYICNFHITNPNKGEMGRFNYFRKPNPLDITGSYCHMSARGNLLLAIDLHKIIAQEL